MKEYSVAWLQDQIEHTGIIMCALSGWEEASLVYLPMGASDMCSFTYRKRVETVFTQNYWVPNDDLKEKVTRMSEQCSDVVFYKNEDPDVLEILGEIR